MDPEQDLFDGAPDGGAPDAKPTAGDSSTPAPGAKAESPPADGKGDSSTPAADKRPASSFEAVLQLMAKKPGEAAAETAKPGETSPASDQEGKDGKAPGDTPDAAAEQPPEEDYEPVKNAKRPLEQRFNRLLEDRKELLPKAQTFDQLQTWTKQNGLTAEQFVRGMEVIALTRSDPKKALEALEPIVQQLRAEAGIVDRLPDDLQTEVNDGRINEERAREIAGLRLGKEGAERRLAATREERERDRQQAQIVEIRKTFSAFDATQAASDPDWTKKRSHIKDALKAIWLDEGMPQTPEQADKQAKAALKSVNERLADLLPKKQSVKPTVPGNGSGPRTVSVRPKTSMDALNAALAGQRTEY